MGWSAARPIHMVVRQHPHLVGKHASVRTRTWTWAECVSAKTKFNTITPHCCPGRHLARVQHEDLGGGVHGEDRGAGAHRHVVARGNRLWLGSKHRLRRSIVGRCQHLGRRTHSHRSACSRVTNIIMMGRKVMPLLGQSAQQHLGARSCSASQFATRATQKCQDNLIGAPTREQRLFQRAGDVERAAQRARQWLRQRPHAQRRAQRVGLHDGDLHAEAVLPRVRVHVHVPCVTYYCNPFHK